MDSARLDHLFSLAGDFLERGIIDRAIDLCREILTEEPDHGQAHALLAVSLLQQNRLVAAEYEAHMGLALEPLDGFSHYAISQVRLAQKRLAEALHHLRIARDIDPDDDDYLRLQGVVLQQLGQASEAEDAYRRALELGPDHASNHAAYGQALYDRGQIAEAERYARQALELSPDDREALLLMGTILLARGDIDGARDHAIWILQTDASDVGGLSLLCGIKARKNILLGGWWRYSTWMGQMGDAHSVFLLVSASIGFSLLFLVLRDLGLPDLSRLTDSLWTGIIAYTWIGPAWFDRALRKEIGSVELSDDF